LDYTWDWSGWLRADEEIEEFSVAVTRSSRPGDTALVIDGEPMQLGGAVTAWIRGGTPGTKYSVTCHIKTNHGRVDDRSHALECNER